MGIAGDRDMGEGTSKHSCLRTETGMKKGRRLPERGGKSVNAAGAGGQWCGRSVVCLPGGADGRGF